MEPQELIDWVDFCEGRKVFDRYHFSTMFMELYLEPLTKQDRNDLRTIFQYVPNSSRLFEKMICIECPAEDKTDEEIIEIVRRDLYEKRKFIKKKEVIDVIDTGVITPTLDEALFEKVRQGNMHGQFCHSLASYWMIPLSESDGKIRALRNAFYGIAHNVHLQDSLTADLLEVEVCFDNYFDLYNIGVDYALDEDKVLVMNYRAAWIRENNGSSD